MSRRLHRLAAGVAAGALLVAGLASCGRQGDLDRPGPLWGARAKADWAAAHRPAPATNAPASNGIPPLPADDTEDNAAPNGAPGGFSAPPP